MSRAHVPTSSPPPFSTVMSRASICVSRITSARRGVGAARGGRERDRARRRRHLLGQALQGPVAPSHHLGRHVGQRDDRADRLAVAGELERRHVALDAVVVGGEGRRLGQLDRAVLADEAAAGARPGRRLTRPRRRPWRRRRPAGGMAERTVGDMAAPRLGDARTTAAPCRLVPVGALASPGLGPRSGVDFVTMMQLEPPGDDVFDGAGARSTRGAGSTAGRSWPRACGPAPRPWRSASTCTRCTPTSSGRATPTSRSASRSTRSRDGRSFVHPQRGRPPGRSA